MNWTVRFNRLDGSRLHARDLDCPLKKKRFRRNNTDFHRVASTSVEKESRRGSLDPISKWIRRDFPLREIFEPSASPRCRSYHGIPPPFKRRVIVKRPRHARFMDLYGSLCSIKIILGKFHSRLSNPAKVGPVIGERSTAFVSSSNLLD